MGPEYLLLLHNLGHAELLLDLEDRARAIRATRVARAERIRALRRAADGAGRIIRRAADGAGVTIRRAADGAGVTIRRAEGPLTGRPVAVDRTPAQVCDGECAAA